MSRSGYVDDAEEGWELALYQGALQSAIRGKRGQKLLRDLLDALDAMPEKALIAEELQTIDGEFCALGALGAARGIDMRQIDPEDREHVAKVFDIAPALASEVVYQNDECGPWRDAESAEDRWARMRAWAAKNLKEGGR